MNNIEYKYIDIPMLVSLIEDIKIINYWIKRKDNLIPKSNFYNIKKHLLNYIMLCCKEGIYKEDEVNYIVNSIEINKDSNGNDYPNKLVSMILNIGDKCFLFHRVLDDRLIHIIGSKKLSELVEKEYVKNDDEFCDISVDELQDKYISLIERLTALEWCIYRYIDVYSWVKIIEKRYNIFKLIPNWNYFKLLEPKGKKTIRIKLFKKQKYEEQIEVEYKSFRLSTDSILREKLPSEYYNLKIY